MFSAFPPSVGSLRAPKEALRVLLVLRAALCSPWGHTPHTRVFIPGGPTTRVFSSLDEARGPHLALTPPRCFSRPRPHRDRPPPSPPPPPPRSRPMTRAPASFLPARPCLPLCPGGGADPTRCCPVLPGPLPPRSPPSPQRAPAASEGPVRPPPPPRRSPAAHASLSPGAGKEAPPAPAPSAAGSGRSELGNGAQRSGRERPGEAAGTPLPVPPPRPPSPPRSPPRRQQVRAGGRAEEEEKEEEAAGPKPRPSPAEGGGRREGGAMAAPLGPA